MGVCNLYTVTGIILLIKKLEKSRELRRNRCTKFFTNKTRGPFQWTQDRVNIIEHRVTRRLAQEHIHDPQILPILLDTALLPLGVSIMKN